MIRTAAIGVGVQGERHAGKLAACPEADLVVVVDIDAGRARQVAGEFGAEAASEYLDVIGRVDAAVVATPASSHFGIAKGLLENGIHVLLEKPIATTVDEAWELVALAERNSAVLQVGHLERFNPAVVALGEHIEAPQFIESTRIAPFQPRGLDVSVLLDLTIHDIDLIHSFVRAPMASVDAIGRSVFSDCIDIANARIHFANGCIASVTSSRTSMKSERMLRIFEADAYLSADLQNKSLTRLAKKRPGPVAGPDDVTVDKRSFGSSDQMLDQVRAFLASVAGGAPPLVSGRIATEALETAIAISDAIGRQGAQ